MWDIIIGRDNQKDGTTAAHTGSEELYVLNAALEDIHLPT